MTDPGNAIHALQVPLEVVKWRAAAENAQAQLDALVDEKGLGACACPLLQGGIGFPCASPSSHQPALICFGTGMWVEAREQTFATRLEEQLKAALADKAALEAQLDGGGGGGAPSGKQSRRLSDGGMTRLREAEGKAQLLEVRGSAAGRPLRVP